MLERRWGGLPWHEFIVRSHGISTVNPGTAAAGRVPRHGQAEYYRTRAAVYPSTMEILTAVTSETRVLDVGATSVDVVEDLARRGVTRYLGLTPDARLPDVRAEAGPYGNRFHELLSNQTVLRASADLLVLRAPYARLLWAARDLGHFRLIAVEKVTGTAKVERWTAAGMARVMGRLERRGVVRLGDLTLELLEVQHRTGTSPRYYFSPVWGAEGLAQRLAAEGLDYVVLRWFDSLPAMEPGEDLDVLVEDDDLDAFRAVLHEEPGTMPLDLYSVSGLPYSDYAGAAYYPPAVARRIISGAERHPSGFTVPNSLDHLHSLAYHAVYHKGLRSGIPSLHGPAVSDPEHDYRAVLGDLAARHGVPEPTSLEGWDEYLASVGWQPSPDALRKLAPSNGWVAARERSPQSSQTEHGELAVFLVREQTLAVTTMDEVLGVLKAFSFDVLAVHELTDEARQRCAAIVRGGNWGPGPFPRSGGPPAVMFVALHYAPGELWDDLRERYPHLTNADVLRVKLRLRDLVASRSTVDGAFNPVHSADNDTEAWEYVTATTPDLVPQIRETVNDRLSRLHIDVPVVRTLSRGRRARVDVVSGPEGPVVRKTFAPSFARYLEREVSTMDALSARVAAVPPVLDRGPNWFTCPYYEDTLGDWEQGRLVPLPILRQMVAALRELYEHGYDLVDAKPQNFLFDPDAGLKIVDFEFIHRYENGEARPFVDTMNFTGAGHDFEGDAPVGDQSYERLWLPYTGLSREVLVNGSPAAQLRHRLLFRARQGSVGSRSPLRRQLGRGRRAVQHARWLAGRRYGQWAGRRAATGRTP